MDSFCEIWKVRRKKVWVFVFQVEQKVGFASYAYPLVHFSGLGHWWNINKSVFACPNCETLKQCVLNFQLVSCETISPLAAKQVGVPAHGSLHALKHKKGILSSIHLSQDRKLRIQQNSWKIPQQKVSSTVRALLASFNFAPTELACFLVESVGKITRHISKRNIFHSIHFTQTTNVSGARVSQSLIRMTTVFSIQKSNFTFKYYITWYFEEYWNFRPSLRKISKTTVWKNLFRSFL